MGNFIINQDAYDLLRQCSAAGDYSEWNTWRKENGFARVYLEHCAFEGGDFTGANLQKVHFSQSRLQGAVFNNVNLQRAWLNNADLRGAQMVRANLRDAVISDANLSDANMNGADLKGARASYSVLKGANFHHAHLEGADFSYAVVNGATLIDTIRIDKKTLFTSVGLLSARLKPGLYESLNYNVKRKRWSDWYESGNLVKRVIKKGIVAPFWMISDYGRSTAKILSFFILFVLLFSTIYCFHPEMIDHLSNQTGDYWASDFNRIHMMYRAVFFSVVTMITLGFGGMNASLYSFWGHLAVTSQVLLGYVMLAALVSRIAVMFEADGPSVSFKAAYRKFSVTKDSISHN